MSFAKFSSDFLMESFTLVDNLFINEHLPYCDEKQIKAYIYGLFLCTSPEKDNSIERMLAVLDTTYDELISAFKYFEDNGLVKVISSDPLEVTFLSLKRAMQPPKKYKSEKWNDFNTHLQSLYHERMIMPNEYNEYYRFLDTHKLERDAMLMIVQYCINLKGENVRYSYILTVAGNWAAEGVRTVGDVERKLEEYETQTEEMRRVLCALGRKSGAELEEKQLLTKWTRSWGYDIEGVLAAANTLKGGKTFKKLDARLDEFYRLSVFTAEEMKDWQKQRDKLRALAIEINKNLGLYYESLDHIIEVYVAPWTLKGFEDEALITLAHHCFVSGIRTLSAMNALVNKFYSMGILTLGSINEYIENELRQDEKIKAVIAATGRSRGVTSGDRDYYRTWSADWGFDDDMILYAASLALGRTYPAAYVNQVLSAWRSKNVTTLEEAKKHSSPADNSKKREHEFKEREYSDDELKTIFSNIENFDDIEI